MDRPAQAVDRLAPAYYDPVRVPPRVAAFASRPDTLAAGSPAKVGILDLAFARVAGRTELVGRYQKSPLQLMRPLYIDPHLPEMAFVYVMSTGGGIAQADRYRTDVVCGADTQVHVTTQAATKVYRMEHDYATQRVHIDAGPGAFVEYLPGPLIPFRDARFYQRTEITIAPGATVIVGETLTAGRLARGERHAYRILTTDLELRRPDGTLLALDTLRLEPGRIGEASARDTASGADGAGGPAGPAVMAGRDHVASLFVVTDRRPAAEVADALHTALATHMHAYPADPDLTYGVSVLPHDCGAWVRMLADHPPRIVDAQRVAWDAVRRLLTGSPAPNLRKS
ncbi:urease accessory protein UreD [Streptomyces sp. SID3343]|uniref:urease accessory protein UreD n=1 Tax=Streptomyces sp. SID3343 TaxID=2690260 RepID=UPI0031FA2A95